MEVTAVVICHNHRRFLPSRLDSILAQTRRPSELILIDDGSTDGSQAWLEAFRSEIPTQVFLHPAASGSPFRHWNFAAERAKGDFLWFAEADDACEPTFLTTLLSRAETSDRTAIVYSQSLLIDDLGNSIGNYLAYTDRIDTEQWKTDYDSNGPLEAARWLGICNTIPNASACLLSRNALLAAGGAEISLPVCGDWVTYGRLLAHGDLSFVAAPLNRYRFHPNTLRAATAREDFVAQSYAARAKIAALHSLPEARLEIARRYALREAADILAVPLERLPAALSPEAKEWLQGFDPQWEARCTNPALQPMDAVDVYTASEGNFDETGKRRRVLSRGVWMTLDFRDLTRYVRVDPISRPGRIEILRVELLDQSTNEPCWRCSAGSGFAGLVAAGHAVLAVEGTVLSVTSTGDDPQLHLPVQRPRKNPLLLRIELRLL